MGGGGTLSHCKLTILCSRLTILSSHRQEKFPPATASTDCPVLLWRSDQDSLGTQKNNLSLSEQIRSPKALFPGGMWMVLECEELQVIILVNWLLLALKKWVMPIWVGEKKGKSLSSHTQSSTSPSGGQKGFSSFWQTRLKALKCPPLI